MGVVGDSLLSSEGSKYPDKLFAWMKTERYANYKYANNAVYARNPWFGLVQSYGTTAGADGDMRDSNYNIICLSLYQVNDAWATAPNFHAECFEATVRVLLTADPTKRIIVVLMPTCDEGVTEVLDMEAWQQAEVDMIQTYPNVIFHDMRQHVIDNLLMLDTWVADKWHLTDAGQVEVKDVIVADWVANPSKYIDDRDHALPARTFDCAKYEFAANFLRGDECTSKSGTGWAVVNTTGWESSTPGDEIIFDVPECVSIGIYYTSGAVIAVSVDGGEYVTKSFGTNGIPLSEFGVAMVRATHNIKFKVVSGKLSVTQIWTQ